VSAFIPVTDELADGPSWTSCPGVGSRSRFTGGRTANSTELTPRWVPTYASGGWVQARRFASITALASSTRAMTSRLSPNCAGRSASHP
jgi:hypothetical protein